MTSPELPSQGAVEAVLVLDTATDGAALGMRSSLRMERRLLFRAPRAHIELRLPPCDDGAAACRVLGQFVATDGVHPIGRPAAPVRVVLLPSTGDSTTATANAVGEFALPCDPTRPFWLEFRTAGSPPVRATFHPERR